MTNCPNCGAPIVAAKCEYCGTVFSNLPQFDTQRSCVIGDINLLKSINRHLEQQIMIEELYTSVLKAMRNYGGQYG